MVLTPENVFVGGGVSFQKKDVLFITLLSNYAITVCMTY